MSRSASPESVGRGWDGPWYRVRTDAFEASFLPSPAEELDSVCNVDVFVDLKDGSRWSATVFTVAEVERLMETWAGSGEALGGRCFWISDGLLALDTVHAVPEPEQRLVDRTRQLHHRRALDVGRRPSNRLSAHPAGHLHAAAHRRHGLKPEQVAAEAR